MQVHCQQEIPETDELAKLKTLSRGLHKCIRDKVIMIVALSKEDEVKKLS